MPELKTCPDREQLIEFALGSLSTIQFDQCHEHISQCDPCEETLLALDVSDTLSELTRHAAIAGQVNGQGSENFADQDVAAVSELVDRIGQWTQGNQIIADRRTEARDRAAEVERCFSDANEIGIGIVGKYQILDLLGAGSSGVVYRAIDTTLGREVAIKFLRPSLGPGAQRRFLAEAQSAALIVHPNVVPIFEVGNANQLAFIAMQLRPGMTLEAILARDRTLPPEESIRIGKQIASGLAAAHQKGIVHRDIKPANIWISQQGNEVTILDFGLARVTDEDPHLTCTGLIAGTPCFMSPEQTRGRDIDGRSDFFSLGCLLYQCLTGTLPFKSENVLATLQSVQLDTPVPPSELDPNVPIELSTLVMTLIEKSPSHRPSNANQIVDALDTPVEDWAFAATAPKANRPRQIPPKLPQPKHHQGWGVASWIAMLFAATTIGLAALFMPQIIRIVTNQGQLVIEASDPDIQIEIRQDGELIKLIDTKTKLEFNIVAGRYELKPVGGANDIRIDKNSVVLSRGSMEVVRVTRAPAPTGSDSSRLKSESSNPTLADKLRKARQLIALGKVDEASACLDEAVTESVKIQHDMLGTFEDSRAAVTSLVQRQRELTELFKNADGDYNRVAPDFLAKQAIALVQYGEYETAAKLLQQARSFPDSKVDDIVSDDIERLIQVALDQLAATQSPPKKQPSPKIYRLDAGDVLAIVIDGVLGSYDESPPIIQPPAGSGLAPSIGYPIPVQDDGTVSLPLIDDVTVRGLTTKQARDKIRAAYIEGEAPILTKDARILITIYQKRTYVPPKVLIADPRD